MTYPPDHYKTLGLARTATHEAVRAAYRRLARKFHPDRYEGKGDSGATMARINQAYQVLSDPESRARYDALTAAPEVSPSIVDTGMIADRRPLFLLWAVISLVVLALGWVALRTLVPRPVPPAPSGVVRLAPVEHEPLAPLPAIEPWKPPPPAVHVGPASTDPVARLIREGTIDKLPSARKDTASGR